MTSYTQHLATHAEQLRDSIDTLLKRFQVVPVGNGYIDLILPIQPSLDLIDALAQLPIAVGALTWWCHCTPTSAMTQGCPHGLGGPNNPFGLGWFSELSGPVGWDVADSGISLANPIHSPLELANACRTAYQSFLLNDWPQRVDFLPCCVPGLWLNVPDDWRRPWYAIDSAGRSLHQAHSR